MNRFKRSAPLFLLMLFTLLNAQFAGGTGTPGDPYQIETPEQLNNVRNYLSSSFILNNDIDLTDYLSPTGSGYNGGEMWLPIGTYTMGNFEDTYTGTFDGNDKSIYGLQINRNDPLLENGLFGYIGQNGTVKNLKLRKRYISEEIISLSSSVGSLAGAVYYGSIINCSSDCNVVSLNTGGGGLVGTLFYATVTDSYFTGSVISEYGVIGGLVEGITGSNVERCYAKCRIKVNSYNTAKPGHDDNQEGCGGFLFSAGSSTISQCFSECEILGLNYTGGFSAFSYYTDYTDCYSKSEVCGDSMVTGFCVVADGGSATACYAAGPVLSKDPDTVSGFIIAPFDDGSNYYPGLNETLSMLWDVDATGQAASDQGFGKSTYQMKYPETFVYFGSDWDFTTPVWVMDPCKYYGYPYLSWYEPEVTFEINGSGTASDPYEIETPEQLDHLGNYAGTYYSVNNFALMSDIDLTAYLDTDGEGYDDGALWEPAGNYYRPFGCTVDGKGFTISGLKINRPDSSYIGLFGQLSSSGSLKDLIVVTDASSSVTGNNNTGIIAGYNKGVIERCSVRGTVTGNEYTGGIAGFMNGGQLTDSYSFADVSANNYAGGLIGKNQSGAVTRCYNAGPVSAMGDAGGLIAWNESANVIDCYWDVETSGQSTAICGLPLTTAQMKERLNYSNWFPSSAWEIHPLFNDGYPFLKYEDIEPYNPFTSGTGTNGDPFQITTPDELELVRLYSGSFSKGKYFRLMNDIDLTGHLSPAGPGYHEGKLWLPVGTPDSVFAGYFQGNSNKIRNMEINRPDEDCIGLFGFTAEDAVITSLKIVNDDSVTVTGGSFTGTLTGVNNGTIELCYAKSDVTGTDITGGIVGHNEDGFIDQCTTSGSVNGVTGTGGLCGFISGGLITDSYSTSAVTGYEGTGGLIGQSVYPAVITNCYSNGPVSGTYDTGGLIGDDFYSDISDCYWDVQTSGQSSSAGGEGKLTSEMTDQATFSGWDFSTPLWNIDPYFNGGYPYFSWESVIYYPQNLMMQIAGSDIDLTWDAVSGATGYRIYGSNDPFGSFMPVADTAENIWSGSVPDDRYFFYVVAYNNEKKRTFNSNTNSLY